MKTAKILTIFTLFATSLFFVSSCAPDPEPTAPTEYGKVLLFHGAAGAAPVDLFVDGTKSTTATVNYGAASGYIQAIADAVARKIQTKNVTGTIIDSVSLTLTKDVGYSYYTYKDNDASGTTRVIATTDALTAPTAGKAKVRFINLIPDVPSNIEIDVEFVATGAAATNSNNFSKVKFKESRDFTEINKGTYDLKIKQTGTVTLLISTPISITLAEGKIYTLAAYGLNSKPNSDPQTAKVATINNN